MLVAPHDAFSRKAQELDLANRSSSESPPLFSNLSVSASPPSYFDTPSGSPERGGIPFNRPANTQPYHRRGHPPPGFDDTPAIPFWAHAHPVAPTYCANTPPVYSNPPPQFVQGSTYGHAQGPAGYAQSPAQFIQGLAHSPQYAQPPPQYFHGQGLAMPPWGYGGQPF